MKLFLAFISLISLIMLANCAPSVNSENTSSYSESPTPPGAEEPLPSVPDVPLKLKFLPVIENLASKSLCAKTVWNDRGKAPLGYIKGMVTAFVRSSCRIKYVGADKPAAAILRSPNSNNPKRDVLSHYREILEPLNLYTDQPGMEPLLATYTIGFGLGMRESSGKYCEGWDVAAGSDRTSAEAEAGLFQASYDSMRASTELKKLYEEYKNNPEKCLLKTFKEGVTCKNQTILGTGAGADYQVFNKSCPAFAAEYAMTFIRLTRSHFGPLNRKTAQVIPACANLLGAVKNIIEADPEAACTEMF